MSFKDMLNMVGSALAMDVAEHHSKLVSKAVTHAIGNEDWIFSEVSSRGEFVTQNGITTFIFDGHEMIKFYPSRTRVRDGHCEVEADYRELY